MYRSSWCSQVRSSFRVVKLSSSKASRVSPSRSLSSSPRQPSLQDRTRCLFPSAEWPSIFNQLLLILLNVVLSYVWSQGQQISVQGQQVAQTADGQTIVYQPVNADGTVLQQGKLRLPLLLVFAFCLVEPINMSSIEFSSWIKTVWMVCLQEWSQFPRLAWQGLRSYRQGGPTLTLQTAAKALWPSPCPSLATWSMQVEWSW